MREWRHAQQWHSHAIAEKATNYLLVVRQYYATEFASVEEIAGSMREWRHAQQWRPHAIHFSTKAE